jgi:BlaI family transcriptional regulator, penicillinase repressor
MPKPKLPRPTDGELAILRVLWERGPSTVRAVQEALGTETGYTTVLKFMQIMNDKGLLTRDDRQRTHTYAAAVPEQATQRQLLRDLLDRAFGGSAKKLVMQLLSAKAASSGELAEIKSLIDDMERNRQ